MEGMDQSEGLFRTKMTP